MYKLLSCKLTNCILLNGFGKNKYRKIYEYGFECFLSIVINITTVIILGIITGYKTELITYMLFYIPLRVNTGGAHRSTHLKCIYTFIFLAFTSIYLLKKINIHPYGMFMMGGMLIISILLVFLYAPVQSVNRILKTELKGVLRRKSLITITIQSIIIILSILLFGSNEIATPAIAGVFIQSILLIPFFNNEEEKL